MTLLGTVINLHRFGAAVRLADGRLASVPAGEVDAHRAMFEESFVAHRPLRLVVRDGSRGLSVVLADFVVTEPEAPSLTDDAFEERLADYLRETEEWAPPDQPQPFERHLTRKRRRAAQFDSSVVRSRAES
ncbi:MAG TPA: hypothetical protein VMD07_08485 [Candidatus Acidoferrales bacterium]|nr:hypothetical protein [Candidatus Acidoferrales bacterium]